MAYKVNLNGVTVEVETLAEVKELAGLTAKQETPTPPPPPEVKPTPPPKARAQKKRAPKQLELPELNGAAAEAVEEFNIPELTNKKKPSLVVADAIRAVEMAYQKYHKPVDFDQILKYSAVPGSRAALSARLQAAVEGGYVQRLAIGVFVPKDYVPEALDGINRQTKKALPKMALPVVQYMVENPKDWDFSSLLDAMMAHTSSSRDAIKLRVWAGRRGGWLEDVGEGRIAVTQKGLDLAASADKE